MFLLGYDDVLLFLEVICSNLSNPKEATSHYRLYVGRPSSVACSRVLQQHHEPDGVMQPDGGGGHGAAICSASCVDAGGDRIPVLVWQRRRQLPSHLQRSYGSIHLERWRPVGTVTWRSEVTERLSPQYLPFILHPTYRIHSRFIAALVTGLWCVFIGGGGGCCCC